MRCGYETNGSNEIVIVESIKKGEPPYTDENYFVNGRVIEDLKPIELTEEWLRRAGFVKIDNRNQFGYFKPISNSRSLCWGFGKDISIEDDETNSMLEYIPCQYVHQLQNLYFALCGSELKIK